MKSIIRIFAGVIIFGLFGIGIWSSHQASEAAKEQASEAAKEKDAAAVAAGFADAKEMSDAAVVGISDVTIYRARLAWLEQVRQGIAAQDDELKRDPTDQMEIDTSSWEKGGFDNVGLMSVTIKNSNAFTVKDITISCRFAAKSGTELSDARHTIYDTIKPKSAKSFRKLNVGFINSQSARAGCRILSALRA